MQTASAVLSVLTAQLTHLWCLDWWDISPWGLVYVSADFLSQVLLLFSVLWYSMFVPPRSLDGNDTGVSCELGSTCSFSHFQPSSDRRSVFSIG